MTSFYTIALFDVNAFLFSAIINTTFFFDKMISCLVRQFSAFCSISVSAETHHVDSAGLVHGAHGHEGGQADGGAVEGHAPVGGKERG